MKVTATQDGYFGGKLRAPGERFEIPDQPKGKNKLPLAFTNVWMRPGWDEAPIEKAPVQSHLEKPGTEASVDEQSEVI